jgi:hypothetical protein
LPEVAPNFGFVPKHNDSGGGKAEKVIHVVLSLKRKKYVRNFNNAMN